MNSQGDNHESSAIGARIDQLCDRFESAWKAGTPPDLATYLLEIEAASHTPALRELLRVELELRRARGDSPTLDDYLQRFPEHASILASAFESFRRRELETIDTAQALATTGFHVRCPHCHNPIELVADAELSDINCPSCGDSFSLLGSGQAGPATGTGTRIGHFELIERLGMGAFGTVWRARDSKLDRTVAVKIPRKGQLDDKETEMFLREARSAAQLRHPNIVSVHEVGRDGDYVYMVSDLIQGMTLDKWLLDQHLTSRETAELCAKIAGALQHAHEKGVVHRDLKPQNILMDAAGEPHLTDFGLAKREAGEITMTMEGQLLGTPAYMSPEQARGEAHVADQRSDIYSLGVVMFQLLTGELPFRGNVRMLLKQVLEDDAPAPRQLDNRIPRDLDTICQKCLAKEPSRRYPTARSLADDLQRFSRNEVIQARPVGQIERAWRWCRRNPVVAGLAAAFIAAIIAGTAASAYFAIQSGLRANEAVAAKKRADEKAEEAVATAQREKQAKQEAAQQRDKAIELTRRTSLQSVEGLVSKSELLWASGALAKDEAIRSIKDAAQICRDLKSLIEGQPIGQKAEFATFGQQLTEQQTRLTRIASKWLTRGALVQGPPLQVPVPKNSHDSGGSSLRVVASPNGTRLAVYDSYADTAEVVDNTGKIVATVSGRPWGSDSPVFIDDSHVSFPTSLSEMVEFDLPATPNGQELSPSKRRPIGADERRSIGEKIRETEMREHMSFISNNLYEIQSQGNRLLARKKTANQTGTFLLWQGQGTDDPSGSGVSDAAFSVTGKQVYFVSSREIGAVDLETGLQQIVPRTVQGDRFDIERERIVVLPDGFLLLTSKMARVQRDVLALQRWQVSMPEVPFVQLDSGEQLTSLTTTSSGEVCAGFADGSVSLRNSKLDQKWRAAGGIPGNLARQAMGTIPFFAPIKFAGPKDEALLLRPQFTPEEIKIVRTSDGHDLPCQTPQGLKFLGTVGDNQFLVYATSGAEKARTAIIDASTQKTVKQFSGVPQNLDARRVFAVTDQARSVLQFWRLPDFKLVGEIPFHPAKNGVPNYTHGEFSDYSGPELEEVLFDKDESCAVVAQHGQRALDPSERSSFDEKVTVFTDVAIAQFEPFLVTSAKSELRIRQYSHSDPPQRSGDYLVLDSRGDSYHKKIILNVQTGTGKSIDKSRGGQLLSNNLPRFLVELGQNTDATAGWDLYDLTSMKVLKTYKEQISASPHFSSTSFALGYDTDATLYRWSDGEKDTSYEPGVLMVGEGWQLRRTPDGIRLKTKSGEPVLQGFDREKMSGHLRHWLSDNESTFISPNGVWDVKSGNRINTRKIENWLSEDEESQKSQRLLVQAKGNDGFRLRTYDLRTGQAIFDVPFQNLRDDRPGSRFVWAPSANRLLTVSSAGLELFDASTGNSLRQISYGTHLEPIKSLAFSNESSAVLSQSAHVVISNDKDHGKFQTEIHRSAAPIRSIDMSGDGKNALVLLENGELFLKKLSGEKIWQQKPPRPDAIGTAAYFASTGQIVVACSDGILRRLSAADGSISAELRMSAKGIALVAIAPSRRYAFLLMEGSTLARVDLEKLTVTKSIRIDAAPKAICAVDDTTCCVGRDHIEAWTLTDGIKRWSIDCPGTPISMLAYQAKEGRLVAVDDKGQGYAIGLEYLSSALAGLGLPSIPVGDRHGQKAIQGPSKEPTVKVTDPPKPPTLVTATMQQPKTSTLPKTSEFKAVATPIEPNRNLENANLKEYAASMMEKLIGAIPEYQKSLADKRKAIPNQENAHLKENAAAKAKLIEAIPGYEKSLANERKTLGNDDQRTLGSTYRLANAYASAGRIGDAIRLWTEIAGRDEKKVPPNWDLMLGELRLIGGNATSAETAIRLAITRGSKSYITNKSLGWCLLAQGKSAEAKEAFRQALQRCHRADGTFDLKGANIDEMTAAYFLDLISEKQYIADAGNDENSASNAWFYVGQRREIAEHRETAIAAYERSVELNPDGSVSWGGMNARWRLDQLRKGADREK